MPGPGGDRGSGGDVGSGGKGGGNGSPGSGGRAGSGDGAGSGGQAGSGGMGGRDGSGIVAPGLPGRDNHEPAKGEPGADESVKAFTLSSCLELQGCHSSCPLWSLDISSSGKSGFGTRRPNNFSTGVECPLGLESASGVSSAGSWLMSQPYAVHRRPGRTACERRRSLLVE